MSGTVLERFGKPGIISGFVVAEEPSRFGAIRSRIGDVAREAREQIDLSKTAASLRDAAFQMRRSLAKTEEPVAVEPELVVPQELLVDPVEPVAVDPDTRLPAQKAPSRLFFGVSAAGLAIATCLALLPAADRPVETEPGVITASVPESPSWREVVKPFPIFVLESRPLNPLRFEYRARNRSDGPTEDMLIYRDAKEGEAGLPAALMVVTRSAKPPVEGETLYAESVVRAGEFGASVLRASMPAPLLTKFGSFEVADLRVATGRGEISCLAFRHTAAEAPLKLSGWKCGKNAHENDRPGLRCFIDRLDIMSAGQSVWLRNYFAQSEADRQFCATAAASTSPDFMGPAAPQLKRDITGTVEAKPKAKQKKPAKAKNQDKARKQPKPKKN